MKTSPSGTRLFIPYYGLVVLLGFGGLLLAFPSIDFSRWGVILLWLALTLLADYYPVHLPNGGYITVASTLDYAGILVLGPAAAALVEVVNTFAVGHIQKKPLKRTVFNAAALAVTILVAGRVYEALGGPTGRLPALPGDLTPLLAMGAAYFMVNTLAVSIVIALADGRNFWRIWGVNFRWTVFHMLAGVLVGLAIAVMFQSLGVWGVFLFVTPLLVAIYFSKMYTDTKAELIDFAHVLSDVIDEIDPYTHEHSRRVEELTGLVARDLQIPEHEIDTIRLAARLHDLGKIRMVHRELLLKPGKLTDEEKRSMCDHALDGARITGRIPSLREASRIVMAHHERFDGKGYPGRLSGTAIPIGSRLIMVADAFDAMTTDRVYRKALSRETALSELQKNAGTQFDPRVVDSLVRLARAGKLDAIPEPAPPAPDPGPAPALEPAGVPLSPVS